MSSTGDNINNLRQHFIQDHISERDFDSILRDAKAVLKQCVAPGLDGTTNGLIYGHIQSGKTAVIITTIALALDNGYKNFVVLTSDMNDLYEQTLDRIRAALHGAVVLGKKEFRQSTAPDEESPLVFVSSKNRTILAQLSQFIGQLERTAETFLIVDDEADQASLNTNAGKKSKPPSGVHSRITALASMLRSYTLLQTTATPQALLLQDDTSMFRPGFVVVTTPGTGYVGGDYLFDLQNAGHIVIVDPLDVANLRTSRKIPASVAESLYLFLAGAAVLRLRGQVKNYAYLLHTSLKQDDHEFAWGVIQQYVASLRTTFGIPAKRSKSLGKQHEAGVKAAYHDLVRSFGGLPSFPTFAEVRAEICKAVTSTEVVEINSRTGSGVKPNHTRRHTIYIGGAKIGRGVTVKNLLVTYYGRDAKSPQVDTVLQHARMYGYRQGELPAIRIFLPQTLADRFHEIHETDNVMREMCVEKGTAIPLIRVASGMRPTRKNVLSEHTELRAYVGGRQYFPMVPISDPRSMSKNQTEEIDSLVAKYEQRVPYGISLDQMLALLRFKFKVPGAVGAWDDELIRKALESLREKCHGLATVVVVNRAASLYKSSSRGGEVLGSVLPGNLPDDPPYRAPSDRPALYLTRLTGQARGDKLWNDVPFWVPVVRFPNGHYAVAVNYT